MKKPKKSIAKRLSRRNFISLTSAASAGLGGLSLAPVSALGKNTPTPFDPSTIVPEWRNRQPGMAYRMLGRTGMMISEVVNGGDPMKRDRPAPSGTRPGKRTQLPRHGTGLWKRGV